MFDFRGGQILLGVRPAETRIEVLAIAMNAVGVALVGQIEMTPKWNAPLVHLGDNAVEVRAGLGAFGTQRLRRHRLRNAVGEIQLQRHEDLLAARATAAARAAATGSHPRGLSES